MTDTIEVTECETIRGVCIPAGVGFRQLIVTGPPCSGKTSLITRLRGWPEEGYLDLTRSGWWRDRILAFRPREVHCGLPFEGHRESRSVFDPEWISSPGELVPHRIWIPPEKKRFFQADWRQRYVFDIQTPPARQLYDIRVARAAKGSHPVDAESLSLELVERQIDVYATLARVLHDGGMRVYLRAEFGGRPRVFRSEPGDSASPGPT